MWIVAFFMFRDTEAENTRENLGMIRPSHDILALVNVVYRSVPNIRSIVNLSTDLSLTWNANTLSFFLRRKDHRQEFCLLGLRSHLTKNSYALYHVACTNTRRFSTAWSLPAQTIRLTVYQRETILHCSLSKRSLSSPFSSRQIYIAVAQSTVYYRAQVASISVASPLSCIVDVTRTATLGHAEEGRINLSFPRDTGESAERGASSASAAVVAVAMGRSTNSEDRRISWVDFAPGGRSSRRLISPRCWAPPRDSLSVRSSLCRWHYRPQDPVSNG